MSAADVEPAKARCSLVARHGGSGFAAYGSPSFVLGAAIGDAIGEGIRAQQDFNDCMEASGWRIADGQTAAAPSVAAPQLRAILIERRACIAQVRSKPDYAPLLPHLSEPGSLKVTMAQLTDEGIPTPAESRLVASYVDEASPCITKSIRAASQAVPAFGPILLSQMSSDEGIVVLLVERKLTWGEAAQQQKNAQEEASAKLHEVRL
jgi:hypothetical protein